MSVSTIEQLRAQLEDQQQQLDAADAVYSARRRDWASLVLSDAEQQEIDAANARAQLALDDCETLWRGRRETRLAIERIESLSASPLKIHVARNHVASSRRHRRGLH